MTLIKSTKQKKQAYKIVDKLRITWYNNHVSKGDRQMSTYIVSIQAYEENCVGIAQGNDPYEAIQNFVEECITLSYNDFKARENGEAIEYKYGYSLPYFVDTTEEFNKLSIPEIAKQYIKDFEESVAMSAYEIPEQAGKAVVAVEIFGRYKKYTTATNGKIQNQLTNEE